MSRAYYSESISQFLEEDRNTILGKLTTNHQFQLEELQRNAWLFQMDVLKQELAAFREGFIFFEFVIPRIGKRVDAVILLSGIIILVEFKVYEKHYPAAAVEQVLDYALDLKNFHSGSKEKTIVPVLVSTHAPDIANTYINYEDRIVKPVYANRTNISRLFEEIVPIYRADEIDASSWEASKYQPTPTIIEAAQALYQGHSVMEISRSDAGAVNLTKTADAINQIIDYSKKNGRKSICFITGVPGAGKTLAGLNIAVARQKYEEEEHAVFLSGNGPLVDVLQEALARNEIEQGGCSTTKKEALRKSKTFIQNIHHFRDEALNTNAPLIEKVAVFDEAQRAWTQEQTARFMRQKRGQAAFDMSEPDFLISVMDRHTDWAVIVCLIGGGQEINTGEAGLPEWFHALRVKYTHWGVYSSDKISDFEYTRGEDLAELHQGLAFSPSPDLHLRVSLRSFRSELVSAFVKALLDEQKDDACALFSEISVNYPIVLTRDLSKAKMWVREKARGSERVGIVASSGAMRLKPYGIFVRQEVDAVNWFLNDAEDIRSSSFLEDVATEYKVQGLELDWACVAWDANLRHINGKWEYFEFSGWKWRGVSTDERKFYLQNAYRVLLTRARQGIVIFIPEGSAEDITRQHEFYDGTYKYLSEIGIPTL